MEIADPLIITAIGSLTGAVAILFQRSEKCLQAREKQELRIDILERAIYGCPIMECPNKPTWKAPITTTLSCSINAQKTL